MVKLSRSVSVITRLASFPVRAEQHAVGARAERRPQGVDAGVRAAKVVRGRTLVDVLAGVPVAAQLRPGNALAAAGVAALGVGARVLAGPVPVSDQALVDVCAK